VHPMSTIQAIFGSAPPMRGSSNESTDNNTAALIMRLADLYDRPADRAATEVISVEAAKTVGGRSLGPQTLGA
jgi:hypothetical protein